jgi:hypothetical protein
MKPTFCATYCTPRADLVPRTLDGHCVWVCPDCDPENPRTSSQPARDYHRGYEVPERDYAATIRAIARAAPSGVTTRDRSVGRTTTPGFVLVRVFRLRGGRSIDRNEARETLRGNSWFAELRHVSSERRWHLFERPDVDLARKVRSENRTDVAAGLIELGKEVP